MVFKIGQRVIIPRAYGPGLHRLGLSEGVVSSDIVSCQIYDKSFVDCHTVSVSWQEKDVVLAVEHIFCDTPEGWKEMDTFKFSKRQIYRNFYQSCGIGFSLELEKVVKITKSMPLYSVQAQRDQNIEMAFKSVSNLNETEMKRIGPHIRN